MIDTENVHFLFLDVWAWDFFNMRVMSIGILSSKTDIIIGEGTREFGMVLDYDCLFFFRKWYIKKKDRKTKREILEASFVDKYDCYCEI